MARQASGSTTRLGRQDWIDEALTALLEGGPDAVAVEPLAKRLGTTKGSFYWHLGSRDELLDEALRLWEERYTDHFIAHAERTGGPAEERLRVLMSAVTQQAPDLIGESRLHAAGHDPRIAPTLRRVNARRTAYVATLLRELGTEDAEARAELAYAVVLGLEQLHAAGSTTVDPATHAAMMMRMLLDGSRAHPAV